MTQMNIMKSTKNIAPRALLKNLSFSLYSPIRRSSLFSYASANAFRRRFFSLLKYQAMPIAMRKNIKRLIKGISQGYGKGSLQGRF